MPAVFGFVEMVAYGMAISFRICRIEAYGEAICYRLEARDGGSGEPGEAGFRPLDRLGEGDL